MAKLKVKGSAETIEVKNVFCIGKNYADHISEVKIEGIDNSIPKEPVVFLKPSTAIEAINNTVSIPKIDSKPISQNLQNEVELVIVIGKDGDEIPEDKALEHVYGYAVGIDFTLRDLQTEMKKQGKPWAVAKGFRTSSPIGGVVPARNIGNAQALDIRLSINGELKQSGNTSQMLFSIKFIIRYLSSIFGLRKGDIIFTGTPAGITQLKAGDKVSAEIQDIGKLEVTIG
ncbi:MAG TPA: fumarylacetoacetate hydrolase family protein [Ignavibacteria bacterium]|nr:acylpyruvase [Bacteroidota bacterium]HRE11695.1 fumarylacetoacetate hydrolase family protein [Ignavibacteria bacterium]HRF66042.1 fumarylacetoacetate hydrolase family protein [Ignavibacteria bacterium]HRJ02882.1 fumarylacetoacetate hydrolase family protein [Ignavibacteria bacterium]HRJ86412.1 fumarylacetoacetate hydrolase family protein [Ignavibacteria bacterium]